MKVYLKVIHVPVFGIDIEPAVYAIQIHSFCSPSLPAERYNKELVCPDTDIVIKLLILPAAFASHDWSSIDEIALPRVSLSAEVVPFGT